MTKRSESAGPNALLAAGWLKAQGAPRTMKEICAHFGWTGHVGIAAMMRAQAERLAYFDRPTTRTRSIRGGTWVHWDMRPTSVPPPPDDDGAIPTVAKRSWGPVPELCRLFGLVPIAHKRPETVLTHRGFTGPQRDERGGQ